MERSTGNKRTTARQRWLEEIVELKPLEYMLKVMNKNSASRKRRVAMARAALPYCHKKLGPIARHRRFPRPISSMHLSCALSLDALDVFCIKILPRHFQVVVGLQIHPEFRTVAEVQT